MLVVSITSYSASYLSYGTVKNSVRPKQRSREVMKSFRYRLYTLAITFPARK